MQTILEEIRQLTSYNNMGALGVIVRSFPAVLISIVFYWLIRRIWHKYKFKKDFKEVHKKSLLNEIIRLLLFAWLAELIAVIFLPQNLWANIWLLITKGSYYATNDVFAFPGDYRVNLIPMVYQAIVNRYIELSDLEMLLGNIAIFIPLGLLLPFICQKSNVSRICISGLLLTLFIELIHPFFYGRSGDIDDVIANTLGTILGYFLYSLVNKMSPAFTDRCKISAKDAFSEILKLDR